MSNTLLEVVRNHPDHNVDASGASGKTVNQPPTQAISKMCWP